MKFNRHYRELYRILTGIILNLALLAWNILSFLLKYTHKEKGKNNVQKERIMSKGHTTMWFAGTFSLPAHPPPDQIQL